ncbi:hypothetical protein CLOM_g4462 [Closterium sp. NIES-68]|nr:hypothetical protein CLOM_g4462 [Closterium sp. NIES-68]
MPRLTGDGPTWGTRSAWGLQQPIEALLSSPGSSIRSKGHHGSSSGASRAASDGAQSPSDAALGPSDAALYHICWSSEPLVNSSTPAAAAEGVVVSGRGCSDEAGSEGHESSGSSDNSSSSTFTSSSGNDSSSSSSSSSSSKHSWWKKDVTLSLQGPALGYGEVQCLDPPACSHSLPTMGRGELQSHSPRGLLQSQLLSCLRHPFQVHLSP